MHLKELMYAKPHPPIVDDLCLAVCNHNYVKPCPPGISDRLLT